MDLKNVQKEIGKFLQKLEEQKGVKPPPKKAAEEPKAAEKPKKPDFAGILDVAQGAILGFKISKAAQDAQAVKKPYKCETCGELFNSMSILADHIKTTHPWEQGKKQWMELLELQEEDYAKDLYESVKAAKTYADLPAPDQSEVLSYMAKLISQEKQYAVVLTIVMESWQISHEGLKVAYDQAEAAVKAFKEKGVLVHKKTSDQAIADYIKSLVETNYNVVEKAVLKKFPLLHASDHLMMLIEGVLTEIEMKKGVKPVPDLGFALAAKEMEAKKVLSESILGMPKPPIPPEYQPFMEQLEVVFEALVQTTDLHIPKTIIIWQEPNGGWHFDAQTGPMGVAKPVPIEKSPEMVFTDNMHFIIDMLKYHHQDHNEMKKALGLLSSQLIKPKPKKKAKPKKKE